MKKILVRLVLSSLVIISSVRAADVVGVVTFKGTPAAETDLGPTMQSTDANCSALYTDKFPTTHFYRVGAAGELADVVVVIKGVPDAKSAGAAAMPVVIDQKGCVYSPTILAAQTGQKIVVKNSDPCPHNVHTTPAQNEEKNFPQMPKGEPNYADLEFTFAKPEPFLKFKCDVHPWMLAYVTVLDHPYFAVSGADGKFTIKNVPPGKYTVEATHRKLGTQTAEVEVKDGGATQNFSFAPK
jgi:plastocyanin